MKTHLLLGLILGICASQQTRSIYLYGPKESNWCNVTVQDNPGEYPSYNKQVLEAKTAKLNGSEPHTVPNPGESDLIFILNQNFAVGVTFDNLKQYLQEISKQYVFTKQTIGKEVKYIFQKADFKSDLGQVYKLDWANQVVSKEYVNKETRSKVDTAALAVYNIKLTNIQPTKGYYRWDWLQCFPYQTLGESYGYPASANQHGLIFYVRITSTTSFGLSLTMPRISVLIPLVEQRPNSDKSSGGWLNFFRFW